MNGEWKGQVALVTGAGRGIGRATARMLAAQGAAVGVNYLSKADAAEAVVAELRGQGVRAIAVGADVADAGAVGAMVERVEAELGPITILVNNAGMVWAASLDSWEPKGYARLHAVNVASIAGLIMGSVPTNHFYASTKAEVLALSKRFAFELGQHGITVNAVAPGHVLSELNQGKFMAEEEYLRRTMVNRHGTLDDIANAILFFASPACGWITAQVLVVDGGRKDFIGHG